MKTTLNSVSAGYRNEITWPQKILEKSRGFSPTKCCSNLTKIDSRAELGLFETMLCKIKLSTNSVYSLCSNCFALHSTGGKNTWNSPLLHILYYAGSYSMEAHRMKIQRRATKMVHRNERYMS